MRWETRKVPVKSPLSITDDPHADVLASALGVIEEREGERRGWNRPARLFALRMPDAGSVEMSLIPERLWNGLGRNPADGLWRIARLLPDVPDLVEPTSYMGEPMCAMGFLFEGWGRPTDLEMSEEEKRVRSLGLRYNHLLAERQEVRLLHAVDLSQDCFHIVRRRGDEPRINASAQRERSSLPEALGIIPEALSRIVHAIRTGRHVFPGQPT
jgi:hypothetical protein